MPWVPQERWKWLEEHGRLEGGKWICKKTDADIMAIETGRSIHLFGLPGGGGEVRRVLHPYCPGCQPNFEAPAYGTPIQEWDLIEVGN